MKRFSYVIITHNRRETLMENLRQVYRASASLPAGEWELWVVDNASTDGTADAVARAHPDAKLIRLTENIGMPARNRAIEHARGEYIVLLDDDSHPIDDAVIRGIDYLDHHPDVGALSGLAILPDGRCEASAMPAVMIGCASILRRSALEQVGLFPEDFFRQAEEYDLSMRLWAAGYRVERFEDLKFRHNKVAAGRCSALTVKMDLRNNLIVAARYLDPELRTLYGQDWSQRYSAIARHQGHGAAAADAFDEALRWMRSPRLLRRRPISDAAVESVFELRRQERRIGKWSDEHGVRTVVIADYSKNIYATYRACQSAGLRIDAIADSRAAFVGLNYRGADVRSEDCLCSARCDGVIISNINPAQVDAIERRIAERFDGPVLRLWHPRFLDASRDRLSLGRVA